MARKVLIVEDQADIRQLITMTLEYEGYELYEATSGDEGWYKIQQIKPDLVLLDVMMPGALDGFQVCEKVKADPALKRTTKVVLLTARSQKSDAEYGSWVGADTYMTKPFSPLQLIETVESLLSGKAPAKS